MKTKIKRQFLICASAADLKILEEHFSRMAAKGWLLTRIAPFYYEYQETEARELQFAVDILPQISAFDYPENESVQEYRRICEESGWSFAAASKQVQVFYSEKKNDMPIPIHTDPKIEAQIILKSSRGEILSFLINLIVLGWLCYTNLKDGYDLFLSNLKMATLSFIIFFLPALFWQIGFVLFSYARTSRAIKNGLPLPKVSFRLSRLRNNFFILSVVIYIVILLISLILEMIIFRGQGPSPIIFLLILIPIGAAFGGLFIRKQVDTKKRERKTNIAIVLGGIAAITLLSMLLVPLIFMSAAPFVWKEHPLPPDRIALRLSDFGINEVPEYANYSGGGSLVVPLNYTYAESDKAGSVRTEVIKTVNRSLTLRLFQELYIEEEEAHYRYERPPLIALTAAEAESFGAEQGYCLNSGNTEFLLLYEASILKVDFSDNLPLPELKQKIAEILRQ